MRLVVTGKQGQIARTICDRAVLAGIEAVPLARPDFDLAAPGTLGALIKSARPDILLSAAAYTSVDKAESEPHLASRINGEAPGEIAQAAADLGIPILHLSTDYVFDGQKPTPYLETDPPAPINHYGASKLAGERAVSRATANHVIVRTAWVYSELGTNFVRTMLRLAETRDRVQVVADQIGQPSYASDIADGLLAMASRLCADPDPALRGIFHMAGGGETHWAGFATEIFRLAKRDVVVEPIATAQYPTAAKRPANSRLACAKLRAGYAIEMPVWTDSLAICMQNLTGAAQ